MTRSIAIFWFMALSALAQTVTTNYLSVTTQAGVTGYTEHRDANGLLTAKEYLRPEPMLARTNQHFSVFSRERYLYNKDGRKLVEIHESFQGKIIMLGVFEYDTSGNLKAERWFNELGHHHFAREYEGGRVVRTFEEGRTNTIANQPSDRTR